MGSRRGLIVGLTLAVGFPLVFFGAGRLLNLTTQGALRSSAANYVQAAADAVVLGVVAAVVLVVRLRWRPIVQEDQRQPSVVVRLLFSLWALGLLVQFFVLRTGGSAPFVVSLLVLVVLVGAAEELIYRGVLVAGLRGVVPEWAVWLLSTVLFALAHLGSAVLGGNPAQLSMTFVLG